MGVTEDNSKDVRYLFTNFIYAKYVMKMHII